MFLFSFQITSFAVLYSFGAVTSLLRCGPQFCFVAHSQAHTTSCVLVRTATYISMPAACSSMYLCMHALMCACQQVGMHAYTHAQTQAQACMQTSTRNYTPHKRHAAINNVETTPFTLQHDVLDGPLQAG